MSCICRAKEAVPSGSAYTYTVTGMAQPAPGYTYMQTPVMQPVMQPQVMQTPVMQPQMMQTQVMQPQMMQPQVMQTPIMQPQMMQPQVMQTPVMQPQFMQPQMMQPVMQAPVMQTPVMQAPVMQTPVVQTPVVQTPVVQTPAVQQTQQTEEKTTYVTNYIYEKEPTQTVHETVEVIEVPDVIEWVPATPSSAPALEHRAVVANSGESTVSARYRITSMSTSPLWVIRAHHDGELIPGRLSVRVQAAYIPYGGKEVSVYNFEVLCVQPHSVRWLPASNGQVPTGAIAAGHTSSGEQLYIGRAKYLGKMFNGKVHPSHGSCYISSGGKEIAQKVYEVLCKIMV